MTDRLLLPTTLTDSLGGADDTLTVDLTGMPAVQGWVDLGSTNQYFEMQAFGINHFPNSRGMRFYMLYEDANNHVRFESPLTDWTTYDVNSLRIYIMKDGVETAVGGGALTVSTDALFAGYASADGNMIIADGKCAFFGFGGVGQAYSNLDNNFFGERWPDPDSFPRGTMIGWDFTEFYAHFGLSTSATLQPWTHAWNGNTYETGRPVAAVLPVAAISGWTPSIDNSHWRDSMSLWHHKNNAVRRTPLDYNPAFTGTGYYVPGGSLSRNVGHQTGQASVRSRTRKCVLGFQGFVDSYQYASNAGSGGGFFQDSSHPYTPDALLMIDSYWDRHLDGLRDNLDYAFERGIGVDAGSITDSEFATLVDTESFWEVGIDFYLNGTRIVPAVGVGTGPSAVIQYVQDSSGFNTSIRPSNASGIGTSASLGGQSGDVSLQLDDSSGNNSFLDEIAEYYDFSFAPYVYGPFAYMIVTDYRDYPASEAHCIFDGHWSQVATSMLLSSDIVRYRWESSLPVTLADGSIVTVQDGSSPTADWRLQPTAGFPALATWHVTLTVYNSDGLSDSTSVDLAVGPGMKPNLTGTPERDNVIFKPYGPRPVV